MSDYSFLVPEMAHDAIETPAFFWLTRSLDIICALFILTIFFYHIYILYSHQEALKTRDRKISGSRAYSNSASVATTRNNQIIAKWSIALHVLTILFILLSFVTIMILLLNIWSVFPLTYSCDSMVYTLCLAFHLSKSTFYSILIVRLQVAFGASAYGYSMCQIYSLFAFVIIYSLVIVGGTPFIIYGQWITEPHNWCHVHISDNGVYTSIGVLSWIIMDVIISIILLYLFQKPIRTLLSNIKTNGKLANLMVKYSILTWISIILSMISLLLYLWKHITTLIEINLGFACFCVVLMHIRYQNIFNTLCGLCTKCCHVLCENGGNAQNKTEISQEIQSKYSNQDSNRKDSSNQDNSKYLSVRKHTGQDSDGVIELVTERNANNSTPTPIMEEEQDGFPEITT